MTLALASDGFVYLRGWRRRRARPVHVIGGWRAAGFLLGAFLIWIAVASPLACGDAHLLTVHMVQHLLLMSLVTLFFGLMSNLFTSTFVSKTLFELALGRRQQVATLSI